MSHVDDGDLNAYLDGALPAIDEAKAESLAAHLEACGECRRRLEEARALRRRATEILELAGPETVQVPPFEDVLAAAGVGGSGSTAGGDRPGRRGGPVPWWMRRGVGLAWAASLALALGLGWVGRGWVPQPAPRELATSVGGRSADLERQVAAPAESSANVAVAEAPERGRGETAVDSEPAELAERADRPAQEDRPAENRLQERVDEQVVVTEAPAPLPRAAEVTGRLLARRDAADSEREAKRFGDDATGLVWIAATRADAERWLDGTLLTVPELPVEEIAVGERDGVRLVRVRQLLAEAAVLELVQGPIEAEEAAEMDAISDLASKAVVRNEELRAADEPAILVIRRAGLLVEATAPVAIDSLRALVSKLH